MPRRNRRAPAPQGISIKASFTGNSSCERVVLLKREDAEEYRTITLDGTRDGVLAQAFSLRNAIVAGQSWNAVDQHSYHGPDDELLSSFSKWRNNG
jgi:hypothetical protein